MRPVLRCLAAGEAAGSVALLAASTPAGQAAIRRILPMPLCLLVVLAVMSCLAMLLPLVAPQSNMMALVCLALAMGLNDVGTCMSGECQGATLPERWASKGWRSDCARPTQAAKGC